MSENQSSLRFAVLLDMTTVKKWQYDCILELHRSPYAKLCAFYINEGVKSQGKSASNSIGFRLLDRSIRNKGPLQLVKLKEKFGDTPSISLATYKKGHSTYLEAGSTQHIKAEKYDFMLRFGFGILRGEVLQLPKYGIWSFHHGNPAAFRGGPAGFWEIYKNVPTTGAILQVLEERLDAGKIIKSGSFQTVLHSYRENFYHLLESTIRWPLIAVTNIVLNEQHDYQPPTKKGPIYKVPGNFQMIIFSFKLLFNRLSLHYTHLFKAELWKTGIVNLKTEELLEKEIKDVKWLTNKDKNKYWADPFSFSDSEILVEEFDYNNGKGSIQKIDESGNSQLYQQQETHLSYPFTFKLDQKRYLLPENNESDALRLFHGKGNILSEKTTLLQGSWVDPTLFFYENTWWLFCTAGNAPKEDLHLFFSDKIDGEYTSHPLNPVLQDIQRARPAGALFISKGEIYRPSQKCDVVYGECIQLNKIETLSRTQYREVCVKRISSASFDKKLIGIHTLNPHGEKTLIDAKTTGFNYVNFKHQLQLKLKKLIR